MLLNLTRWHDLQTPGAYQALPRIPRADVRLLWVADFWDIPLNGMLLYQGVKHWFEIVEGQHPDDVNTRCAVLVLTAEQTAELDFWHDLFREKVGAHWDLDEHGKRAGEVKSPETHHEFYDAYQQRDHRDDFSDNIVSGWFDL